VFIPAGSGGIGTFAIQLAKHLGATVGTTTSSANVELVKSLGASEVVDYTKQDFKQVLGGYDVVLGTLRGDAIKESLRILKPNGIVVSLVGPLDADFGRARGMGGLFVLVFRLMSFWVLRQARKLHVRYSFLFVHPSGSQLSAIGELLRAETIRPVVDRVFPFDRVKEALAYLETGRAKGKVVVQMR
jgi:NADPH:quinone reductase-like Zn-dependent oxidoreductase